MGNIDFEAILEQFEQEQTVFHSGELVAGTVVGITDRGVLVDFGFKSEGFVPLEEFTSPEGEMLAKVGDAVDVVIRSIHSGDGAPQLSRMDALGRKVWDEIETAFNSETPVVGKVVDKTKGGLKVDLNGIEAFLPGSQIDSRPIRGLDTYIGEEIEARVIKFSRRRNDIVLSRKVVLEQNNDSDSAPPRARNVTSGDNNLSASDVATQRNQHPKLDFIIDGTNICKWSGNWNFCTLLTLLIALINSNRSFFCFLDANTKYKIWVDNEELIKTYEDFLLVHTGHFYEITGGLQADDAIVQHANRNNARIISNDKFNPYWSRYPWLCDSEKQRNSNRVIKGSAAANFLNVYDLGIYEDISSDLIKLMSDLDKLLESQ